MNDAPAAPAAPKAFDPAALLAPRQALVAYFARVSIAPPVEESVALEACFGRILARNVVARADVPAHARSTMDGFAVDSRFTQPARRLVGEILMGTLSAASIGIDEAMRVPTGGMLPRGADAVIPQEDVNWFGDSVSATGAVQPGAFVTPRASDMRAGEVALERGRRIGAAELGVLAALGECDVRVYRRARFAVISTGDELVAPTQEPVNGQIRDSNRFALGGALEALGCAVELHAPVPDDRGRLRAALVNALEQCDGVVLSGGSSVGTRDLVPEVVREAGAPGTIVHGLRVKPGKPTLLGAVGGKPVIGLPGNPTSALMMLEAVAKPIVEAAVGYVAPRRITTSARALEPFTGREGWTWFVPARLTLVEGTLYARPLALHSAHVSLLARAHGFVAVGERRHRIEAGELVEVEPFSSAAGPPLDSH